MVGVSTSIEDCSRKAQRSPELLILHSCHHPHFLPSRAVANFRKTGSITTQYCEINIYVTRAPKEQTKFDARKLGRHDSIRRGVDQEGKEKNMAGANVSIEFTKAKLMETLLNPPSSSKEQNRIMDLGKNAPNRLQDIWIWNGRPDWDQIFSRYVLNRLLLAHLCRTSALTIIHFSACPIGLKIPRKASFPLPKLVSRSVAHPSLARILQ